MAERVYIELKGKQRALYHNLRGKKDTVEFTKEVLTKGLQALQQKNETKRNK